MNFVTKIKSIYGSNLVIRGKSLPLDRKKELLGLVYKAILQKFGMPSAFVDTALRRMPEHEIDLEWKAVVDGTVSKVVKVLMSRKLDDAAKADISSIFEGLAVPYFKEYEGKVPKADLEWAHKEIKDYFSKLEKTLESDDNLLPQSADRPLLK